MEFTVNMQPELMIDPLWLIIGGVVFLVSVFFFVMLFRYRMYPRKKKVKAPKPPRKPTEAEVRSTALNSIDKLVNDLNRGKADIRDSYQGLSTVMRIFVSDISGIDVRSYTLSDLKEAGENRLSELLTNYYAPEFAMKTVADFMYDAEVARQLVKIWN